MEDQNDIDLAGNAESLLQSRAIQENFDTLVTVTKSDAERIAQQCFAKGLIPAVLTENANMVKILHSIRDKVSAERTGTSFNNFLEILRQDKSTEQLAGYVRESLIKLRQQSPSPFQTSHWPLYDNVVPGTRSREGGDLVHSTQPQCISTSTEVSADTRTASSLHLGTVPHLTGSTPFSSYTLFSSQFTLPMPPRVTQFQGPLSPLLESDASYVPRLSDTYPTTTAAKYNSKKESTEEDEEEGEDEGSPVPSLGRESSIEDLVTGEQEQGSLSTCTPHCAHTSCDTSKSSGVDPRGYCVQDIGRKLKKCKLKKPSESKPSCSCVHFRETERLSAELESLQAVHYKERGYLISLSMKEDSRTQQLKVTEKKNRKQAKKIKELESKMAEFVSQDGENRQKITNLTQQMMYMEMYCNEARSEMIKTQEQLLSARGRLMQHTEREKYNKERLTFLEKSLQTCMNERFLSHRETKELKRRVGVQEKLIERFEESLDETDGTSDSDTNTAGLTCLGKQLKRHNTM